MEYLKHIVLDAARMDGNIYMAQELCEQHRCLYKGESKTRLGSSAPWLFVLDEYSDFTDWLSENAAGNSWGVIIISQSSMEEVRRHLRKFLIVQRENGKELYFRFYDPRVLRVFLLSCDTEQLQEFFGLVEAFIMEDEDGKMIRFQLDGDELQVYELGVKLEGYLLNPDGFSPDDDLKAKPKPEEPSEKKEGKWNFDFQ